MTTNNLRRLLQLFAGEGAGSGAAGDGAGAAAAGESADAAGQQLRDLGVPEDKIRKNRSYNNQSKQPNAVRNAEVAEAPQQADAAAEEMPTEEPPAKASWDEIMKDPDYNREMQKTVKAAKAKSQAAEDALAALAPALQKIAKEHGLDPDNLDYVALNKAMNGEYEQKAAELGVSTEIAMKLDQQERTLEQQKFADHLRGLEQQGENLKQVFPNFDLRAEMQNPTFRRLTSPNMGMSVEDAYYAVHRREIEAAKAQAITRVTQQQIANTIAAGQRRPNESGVSGQAPSVTTFDYSKASKEEREALKARIRRGEKIYPD